MSVAEALNQIARVSPLVAAVGVTDYATTASFRLAAVAHSEGAGATIELIFPNVELRLDVPTSSGSAVNVHLLCSAEDVDHLDRVLARVEFGYGGRAYRATRSDLVSLGRAFREDESLDEVAALRVGTTQFKASFANLRDVLTADSWAREHCLVGFAGGQRDGTSGVRIPDGGFEAQRQEIERFAQIIFSGSPKQRDYWLGNGTCDRATLASRYGGRKLCLHGSDAHSSDRLGVPDQQRFCWLKGSPSFSTLQQACIEPEYRAFVGAEPPVGASAQRRIAQLVVSSSDWFPDSPIQMNPGLVAIIGPRGSGKTALADLVAAGANSVAPFENRRSFISRAGELLTDVTVAVEWTDDGITSQDLGSRPVEDDLASEPPVRYLSQQFVDDLCAVDGISDLLRKEIERVVFDALPAEDRLGASDFDEVLSLRLHAPKEREAAELEAIDDLSAEVMRLRDLQGSIPGLESQRKSQRGRLAELEREATELTKKADRATADRFSMVSQILQDRDREAQGLARRINALMALSEAASRARSTTFPNYVSQLKERNPDVALSEEQWADFVPIFSGDVDFVIAQECSDAEQRRSQLVGDSTEAPPGADLDALDEVGLRQQSIARLLPEFARLRELVGLDEQRTKRLAEITAAGGQLRAKIQRLDEQLNSASGTAVALEQVTERRLYRYASYFDALLEEEQILTELYSPLAEILAAGGSSVSKLTFGVRREVDLAGWAQAGERLLDLRTDGPFRGRGSLEQAARELLLEAWQSGNGAAAAQAIRDFSGKYSDSLRNHARISREDALGYRDWVEQVSRWMYRADHVELRYSVEYDGLDITRLSPGTRGVVLLLLYLAVDRSESCPLIIDQPEENLDPESVYTELVSLFRDTAERRQVIMVTHNANLVVNTDVDQVIVASCGRLEMGRLPELSYTSGGLEDATIRSFVCQILEGGESAFKERARRLRVGWQNREN